MANKSPIGPADKPGKNPVPASVLPEIVRNLRRQPLLLFGLGGAIVIVAAGTAVFEDRRSVTIPVLIVLAIAAVGWIALEALRTRTAIKTARAAGGVTTGKVGIGTGAKVDDKATIRTGVSGAPQGDTTTGDIKVGRGAQLGKGVRIDTGVSSDKAERPQPRRPERRG